MIDQETLISVLKKNTERAKLAADNPNVFEKLSALTESLAVLTALSLDKQADKLKGVSTHLAVQGKDTTEINKWLNGYSLVHKNFFLPK
jgi:hypothetical protein